MQNLKAFLFVFTAPVILVTCFHVNVIKTEAKRGPAIEKVRQYQFNKSLLVQVAELRK